MPINPSSPSLKSFADFAQAVRSSGIPPTKAEAKAAAQRFAVPLAEVLTLRDEMLKASNTATEHAGQRSQELRTHGGGGVPVGTPNVQGLGGPTQARISGAETSKAMLAVPRYVDVDSARVIWGVHLGNEQASSATATLEDGKNNQIHVQVPVKGEDLEPRIGFMKKGATGEVALQHVTPKLAANLLPFLDATLSNSPRPNAHGGGQAYGAAVVERLREHCEGVLLAAGAPSRAEDKAAFDSATATFDKGGFAKGEKVVTALANGSAFADIRALAHFVLGEMQFRLGRPDDALRSIRLALPGLPEGGRLAALELMAKIHNAKREFASGKTLAQQAVQEGNALLQLGLKVNLASAHFTLGVAQKNLGEIDDAVMSMHHALAAKPGATYIQLALAGYLGIAGKKAEAEAKFAAIAVPPKTELAFLDYNTNATWFYAVCRDEQQVLRFAAQALEAAKGFHFPGTVSYFRSEPDLDWMRGNAQFQQLLARYGG